METDTLVDVDGVVDGGVKLVTISVKDWPGAALAIATINPWLTNSSPWRAIVFGTPCSINCVRSKR